MKRWVCAALAVLLLLTGCAYSPTVFLDGDNGDGASVFTEDCSSIETPYGVLKYPEKWQDHIRIEKQELQDSYCVALYGTVDDHPEQRLFELWFGATGGDMPMGSIRTEQGETVRVALTYCELDMDGWTTEQQDTLCAMQEDANYILNNLELF